MAKTTYYGIFQRGKLVQAGMRLPDSTATVKMPLIFLSKHLAEAVARERCETLKKPNRVKTVAL
jgi:hypothetical protein